MADRIDPAMIGGSFTRGGGRVVDAGADSPPPLACRVASHLSDSSRIGTWPYFATVIYGIRATSWSLRPYPALSRDQRHRRPTATIRRHCRRRPLAGTRELVALVGVPRFDVPPGRLFTWRDVFDAESVSIRRPRQLLRIASVAGGATTVCHSLQWNRTDQFRRPWWNAPPGRSGVGNHFATGRRVFAPAHDDLAPRGGCR